MTTMKVTTKSLRTRAREILDCVDRGEPVTITYRGKPRARLVSVDDDRDTAGKSPADLPVFGMWRDRDEMENVAGVVDSLRRGRFDAD